MAPRVRHAYQAVPDLNENPAKQVGRVRWNETFTATVSRMN